jgi:hypothetical protein
MTSNEKEIRAHLKAVISKKHSEFIIIDEFTGGTMKTRCDLMCISQTTIGMIEIKSDRDTLDRLESQVSNYLEYSHCVLVVMDVCHRKKFLELREKQTALQNWYVVYAFYENNALIGGISQFLHHQRFKPIEHSKLYQLLWGDEVKSLVEFLKGRSKLSVSNSPTYLEAIETIYTIKELKILMHEILFTRVKFISERLAESKQRYTTGYSGGRAISKIQYLDHKQNLFNSIF